MSPILFSILALLSLEPTAQASSGACARYFGKIGHNSYVVPLRGPGFRDAAEANLKQLSEIDIEKVFPEKIYQGQGSQKIAVKVKVTKASQEKFNELFDEFWSNRVKAGYLPSWELVRYRKWLNKQSGSAGPYPPLDPKSLLKMIKKSDGEITDQAFNGKIAEYFDESFLTYLEKERFEHYESINEFFSVVDRRLLYHAYEAGIKRGAKVLTGWVGGALAATFLMSGLPTETVQSFFAPLVQPWRESVKSNARGLGEKLVVTDWTAFKGGEDKYVQELVVLSRENYWFERLSFSKSSREDGVKWFEGYVSRMSGILPQFQPLVEREDKTFLKNWETRVELARLPITQIHSNYAQMKSNHLNLKREIEDRGVDYKMRPTEDEQLKFLEGQIYRDQSYIASLLADWIFFRIVKGEDTSISPNLNRAFRYIYESYLQTMDIDVLAKAVGRRMQLHTNQLENYSNKAKGNKVDPANFPEHRPEDEINKEGIMHDPGNT